MQIRQQPVHYPAQAVVFNPKRTIGAKGRKAIKYHISMAYLRNIMTYIKIILLQDMVVNKILELILVAFRYRYHSTAYNDTATINHFNFSHIDNK